jgi:hypothetical protein
MAAKEVIHFLFWAQPATPLVFPVRPSPEPVAKYPLPRWTHSRSRTELAVGVGSNGVRETELPEIAQESWKALTPIEESRR